MVAVGDEPAKLSASARATPTRRFARADLRHGLNRWVKPVSPSANARRIAVPSSAVCRRKTRAPRGHEIGHAPGAAPLRGELHQ